MADLSLEELSVLSLTCPDCGSRLVDQGKGLACSNPDCFIFIEWVDQGERESITGGVIL